MDDQPRQPSAMLVTLEERPRTPAVSTRCLVVKVLVASADIRIILEGFRGRI